MSESNLPPMPEYAHEFRPRWPNDEGGFSGAQMRAYAAAAVAAERAKWRILTDESAHIYNGGCPEHGKWDSRDPNCPACVALGDWVAT